MRTTVLSLFAALLVLAPGCGPTDGAENGNGGNGGGNGVGDDDLPLPDGVLIFHGRGGVGPEGMWGDMTHEESIAYLEAGGLQVSHTASWPGSLDAFRLVILPAPGFTDQTAFSGAEVSAMRSFVEDGGIVAIEAENGAVLDYGVMNPLLVGLGATAQMDGGFWNGSATTIAEHPLMTGISTIGLAAAGGMAANDDPCLAQSGEECLVSAAAVGEGYVVLIADGNTLSDLSDWDTAENDNRRLVANLARLEQ